ncbi:MAG TPA: sugar phosphate isomerase/epimerase [Planctomycetota bacterium]|nr:sugar phosphate isomerase/epimerase [Planctomycetota bacterium]
MKIGVNTYTMGFAGSMDARLKKAAEIGFAAIEFRPDDFGLAGNLSAAATAAQTVKNLLNKHGLAPCTVACDSDFVQPDKEKFHHWISWAEYCAALSAKLGLKVVKYFAGEPKPGLSDQQIVDFMIAGSKHLARIAEKHGVSFAEENHGGFTNKPEIQLQIIKAVGSKNVGVCIDSSNYRWFGHPLADVHSFFAKMAPYTLHTHVKNGIGSPGGPATYKATALGEGEIDIKLLLTELKKAGYKGDLVLEYEGPDGEAGVRRSLAFLQKTKDEVFGK